MVTRVGRYPCPHSERRDDRQLRRVQGLHDPSIKSIADIQRKIAERVAQVSKGNGSRQREPEPERSAGEKRFPTKEDLDAVFPRIRVTRRSAAMSCSE